MASARPRAPISVSRFTRCRSTVDTATPSSPAIALFVDPATTRRKTCTSRGVSPCAAAGDFVCPSLDARDVDSLAVPARRNRSIAATFSSWTRPAIELSFAIDKLGTSNTGCHLSTQLERSKREGRFMRHQCWCRHVRKKTGDIDARGGRIERGETRRRRRLQGGLSALAKGTAFFEPSGDAHVDVEEDLPLTVARCGRGIGGAKFRDREIARA